MASPNELTDEQAKAWAEDIRRKRELEMDNAALRSKLEEMTTARDLIFRELLAIVPAELRKFK